MTLILQSIRARLGGAALIILAGAPLALATCAPTKAAAAAAPDPRTICREVLGTTPGSEQQGACIESLTRTLNGVRTAQFRADARRECLGRGLNPGDPAFDKCIVERSRGGPELISTPRPRSQPHASGSYFRASPSEVRYRERLACASLGLDPDTSGFAVCVSDLQAAMFEADHPMN